MRKLLIIPLALLALGAGPGPTHNTDPRRGADPATYLDAVAMTESAANRTFTLTNPLGFANAIFFVDYDDGNNGVLTFTCTASEDGNTTDFQPTTCSVSAGTCNLNFGGVFVTPALSADTNFTFAMGIHGWRDGQCVVSDSTANAGDIVTVTGYLITQ